MSSILDKMLSEIGTDERITDGMFSLENDIHMEVMREYFINKGISESDAIEFSNTVLEGKYPERQAYNVNGILVTFPTPEYKAAAIAKGTHFEKNPKKAQSNIFGGPDAPDLTPSKPEEPKSDTPDSEKLTGPTPSSVPTTAPATPTTAPAPTPPAIPSTKLPMSTAAPQNTGDVQATTNVAPQASPEEKPAPEPTTLPPPPIKPPAEKDAEKKIIKKILTGDDFMLEESSKDVITFDRNLFRIKYSLLKMYISELSKAYTSNPNEPIKSVGKYIVELKDTIESFKL